MIGTRDPEKLHAWKEQAGPEAHVGSFEEAARFGDTIVLATKGSASMEVIDLAGKHNLDGKTVIDTTNPIDTTQPATKGLLSLYTSLDLSQMEQLQAANPDAHFVKAFNTINSALMVNPRYEEGRPTMFICGNHEAAKQEVSRILDLFGFDTEDMGQAEAARAIEPLCVLWCIPGFTRNQWTHAFKFLKNPQPR